MRLFPLRSLSYAVMAGYIGFFVLGSRPAIAGDDGQGSILGALVGKVTGADDLLNTTPPITYHERAPLVMPSKKNTGDELPLPSNTPIDRTQAWPSDPDVARAHQAKTRAKMPEITKDNSDKLSNEELARGKVASNTAQVAPVVDCDAASRGCGDPRAIWDPLKQSKAADADVKILQPGVEPSRDYLTQPPKGYLAPQKVMKYTFDGPSQNFASDTNESASDYYRQQAERKAAE